MASGQGLRTYRGTPSHPRPPELSGQEFNTAKLVVKVLSQVGLSPRLLPGATA